MTGIRNFRALRHSTLSIAYVQTASRSAAEWVKQTPGVSVWTDTTPFSFYTRGVLGWIAQLWFGIQAGTRILDGWIWDWQNEQNLAANFSTLQNSMRWSDEYDGIFRASNVAMIFTAHLILLLSMMLLSLTHGLVPRCFVPAAASYY